jgi:succinate dehydrogenase / fumarate reductase, flavoprotein subunit
MAPLLHPRGQLRRRVGSVVVEGNRQYNPGWHLALDLPNMLVVSEAVAQAALLRTESRGGHTRDDHPTLDAEWRNKLLVCQALADEDPMTPRVSVEPKPQLPMRQDLVELFEIDELAKYYTDAELTTHPDHKGDA